MAGHRCCPGGDTVLFTASASAGLQDNASIGAVSLKTGQVKILQRGGYFGRYLPGGYLVYMHLGVLFGVRFDPSRLEVRGAPTPWMEDVAANQLTGGGQFDFSGTGTFVYAAGKGAAQKWQVAWLDSSGKTQPLVSAPGALAVPRLSPDRRRLPFSGDGQDIYVHDLERDTPTRLTFGGHTTVPVWTPDGKHIVFGSASNDYSLYWIRSDGAGEPQLIQKGTNEFLPWSFSPDGRRLAYAERSNPETGFDIWTLLLDITDPDHPKAGKPEPFLRTAADESLPRFSPDEHWIA